MEKIKVMRDWLQTEHNMFLPDEVHNIISEEDLNKIKGYREQFRGKDVWNSWFD